MTETDRWEIHAGQRRAVHMAVTIDRVIETQAIAVGTSAQKAELTALTDALESFQRKNVNVCSDSKHTFMVVHAQGQ